MFNIIMMPYTFIFRLLVLKRTRRSGLFEDKQSEYDGSTLLIDHSACACINNLPTIPQCMCGSTSALLCLLVCLLIISNVVLNYELCQASPPHCMFYILVVFIIHCLVPYEVYKHLNFRLCAYNLHASML